MFVELCIAAVALLAYYYYRFRQRTNYWAERGIPSPKETSFPFGNNPITDFRFLAGLKNPVSCFSFAACLNIFL